MDRAAFQEALLQVMEAKTHWAWPAFTSGAVPAELLHIHLEQEYATYVRDFAVLIGRAYVMCPSPAVRRELAENLYEEETGGLSRGRPHAELFLEYPKGLGMDLSRFESVTLLPAAAAYRAYIDHVTSPEGGWDAGAAAVTLFIEGTSYERGELDDAAPKRPEPPLADHPLVKHYGLPLRSLELTKVHREVEGTHRAAAWRIVLGGIDAARRAAVVEAMEQMCARWKAYRDDVAAACGVARGPSSGPESYHILSRTGL